MPIRLTSQQHEEIALALRQLAREVQREARDTVRATQNWDDQAAVRLRHEADAIKELAEAIGTADGCWYEPGRLEER